MVQVSLDYTSTGACGVPSCTLAVTSNQQLGPNDWQALDPHHLLLLAASAHNGHARIYTVSVNCVSPGGTGSASKSTAVPVAKD
jgi:hypothetical protein